MFPAATEHSCPPLLAGVVMIKLRVATPVGPHGSEQSLRSPYEPTQSTGSGGGGGQASVLHAWLSLVPSASQVPPLAAGVVTMKLRVCVPPPHGTEQSVQLPIEPTQSTGHAISVLQD